MNITEFAPTTKVAVQPSPTWPPAQSPASQRPLDVEHSAAERIKKQERSGDEKKAKPDVRTLDAAVEQMNSAMGAFNRSVSFNVNSKNGQVQVRVVDQDSDKVIREIPPKEILEMVDRIDEFMGVILDEKR